MKRKSDGAEAFPTRAHCSLSCSAYRVHVFNKASPSSSKFETFLNVLNDTQHHRCQSTEVETERWQVGACVSGSVVSTLLPVLHHLIMLHHVLEYYRYSWQYVPLTSVCWYSRNSAHPIYGIQKILQICDDGRIINTEKPQTEQQSACSFSPWRPACVSL